MASDSRITWGSSRRRWDAGRKLFACAYHQDIFGFIGEVIFPSLVLGQVVEAADRGLIFADLEDYPKERHEEFVETVKISFGRRHSAPDHNFQILHGARMSSGLECKFLMWLLSCSAHDQSWCDQEIVVPADHSSLIIAFRLGC
jgi:hypothetical protein